MKRESFGQLPDGREVHLFTLARGQVEAKISNYGGSLISFLQPDSTGKKEDIILGPGNLEGCLGPHPFMNTLIGRFANRIARGKFDIEGHPYQLPLNLPPHHIHGGERGFDKQLWNAEDVSDQYADRLKLTYTSHHGEMGYPGTLEVEVVFGLSAQHELSLDYLARTQQKTHVNLTHHGYFNLRGRGDILGHRLMIDAEEIIAADEDGIPLASPFMDVAGTPFDFREMTLLGPRLEAHHEQLALAKGFDRSYRFRNWDGSLRRVARVTEEKSGRVMEVLATAPGVQLYTANFLQDVVGKGGRVYKPYDAFCLETQYFPDSPNRAEFPSTLLVPGEDYRQKTIYRFSTL